MKPTKEKIIQTDLQIVDEIFKETYNIKTASAIKAKVKIYALGNEGYYEHDGWCFDVNNEKK